jgi:hypothetical protein
MAAIAGAQTWPIALPMRSRIPFMHQLIANAGHIAL